MNLFQYGKRSCDYVIEEVSDEVGWEEIRDNLAFTSGLGSVPYIRVVDLNKQDNTLTLEHVFDGRELELSYAKETLKYIQTLWGHTVKLITKGRDMKEFSLTCDYTGKVIMNDK